MIDYDDDEHVHEEEDMVLNEEGVGDDERTFPSLRFEDEVVEITSYCVTVQLNRLGKPLFGVTSITRIEQAVCCTDDDGDQYCQTFKKPI